MASGRTASAPARGGRGDVDVLSDTGATGQRCNGYEGDTWEHPSSISRSIGGWGLTGGELPRAGRAGFATVERWWR